MIWLGAALRFGASVEALHSATFLTLLLGIALTKKHTGSGRTMPLAGNLGALGFRDRALEAGRLAERWWENRFRIYYPPFRPELPSIWGTIDLAAGFGRILPAFEAVRELTNGVGVDVAMDAYGLLTNIADAPSIAAIAGHWHAAVSAHTATKNSTTWRNGEDMGRV